MAERDDITRILPAPTSIDDLSIALRGVFLWALNRQLASEAQGGRLRVVLDAGPGAQTLANVTTVGTVSTLTAGTITNVSNLVAMGPASAGIPIRDAHITPQERILWQQSVRARIT